MQLSNNFYGYEFVCKCGCGLLRLHPGFIESLQMVRDELDRKMMILSGCRCTAHNASPSVRGHPRSLHISDQAQHPGQQGLLAVDVAAVDGWFRAELFSIAWRRGFSIGWNAARRFLHLDRRDLVGLPQTSFDY